MTFLSFMGFILTAAIIVYALFLILLLIADYLKIKNKVLLIEATINELYDDVLIRSEEAIKKNKSKKS